MGILIKDDMGETLPKSVSLAEKLEICRQTIEKFKSEKGVIRGVYQCRWCLTQRVLEKGDICHICADGVEERGLAFKSDAGFPWVRALVGTLVFIIVLGIICAAQK
jgi:hypothetical protein